jgi:LPS-assembly protein
MYHGSPARWEFHFQHQEEFAEDLSARADINLVSDEHYYYDLEKKIEMKSMPYLDSNAFYVERWNSASLYLLGQYSTDLTRTNENTVQKLPELRYTIYEETLGGPIHLNFEGTATNFVRQEQDGVRRMDFNPQLTAAFGSSGLSLTPRAGVRATFYDRSADSTEATERKYVYAGADLNARISRVYGADGESGIGRMRHSIEPTISYSYIPHVDQATIPQFDSIDSVSAQNLATLSLINRLTAHYKEAKDSAAFTTYDVMVFKLSQTYDLNVARDQSNPAHPQSDVLGELYVRTPKLFTITASASYNTFDHTMTSHSAGAGLAASVLTLNLSETYARGNPPTQYVIGGMGLNLGKWSLTGQGSRDMENKKTTQENYSLHYAAQCWGLRVDYTAMPGEYRYTAMVDLKGIGNRGYGKK